MSSVTLKVLEAYTRDVGRGIARIDYDSMDKLGCSTGDVIYIMGKRTTVAKCMPLYPSDENQAKLRIDGLIRNNATTAIGEQLTIEKAKAAAAEIVTIIGIEKMPSIDERYIADACESISMVVGDEGMIPYFGGRIRFKVVDIKPKDTPVLITNKTTFIIKDKDNPPMPVEFYEVFDSERKNLVNSLKESVKEKRFDDFLSHIKNINELDDLANKVRKILESEK